MLSEENRISAARLGMILLPERVSVIPTVRDGRRVLHEDIEIKCFYEGASTLVVGNHTLQVQAGDVVVINPYEFHTTVNCNAGTGTGKYHLFMIPLDFFDERAAGDLNLRPLLLSNNYALQPLFAQDAELFEMLSGIVREYVDKKEGYAAMIRARMTEVFVTLLRRGLVARDPSERKEGHLRQYHLIEPALREIRDRYHAPIGIDHLAALCNVSKHHFCHVFRDVMKSSAMEYLQRHRLQIADILLCNTEKSIGVIAEECGFESAAYFCRLYKKRYGIAPGKRRR